MKPVLRYPQTKKLKFVKSLSVGTQSVSDLRLLDDRRQALQNLLSTPAQITSARVLDAVSNYLPYIQSLFDVVVRTGRLPLKRELDFKWSSSMHKKDRLFELPTLSFEIMMPLYTLAAATFNFATEQLIQIPMGILSTTEMNAPSKEERAAKGKEFLTPLQDFRRAAGVYEHILADYVTKVRDPDVDIVHPPELVIAFPEAMKDLCLAMAHLTLVSKGLVENTQPEVLAQLSMGARKGFQDFISKLKNAEEYKNIIGDVRDLAEWFENLALARAFSCAGVHSTQQKNYALARKYHENTMDLLKTKLETKIPRPWRDDFSEAFRHEFMMYKSRHELSIADSRIYVSDPVEVAPEPGEKNLLTSVSYEKPACVFDELVLKHEERAKAASDAKKKKEVEELKKQGVLSTKTKEKEAQPTSSPDEGSSGDSEGDQPTAPPDLMI